MIPQTQITNGDEEWDFDYEALLCEYYGVEELIEDIRSENLHISFVIRRF